MPNKKLLTFAVGAVCAGLIFTLVPNKEDSSQLTAQNKSADDVSKQQMHSLNRQANLTAPDLSQLPVFSTAINYDSPFSKQAAKQFFKGQQAHQNEKSIFIASDNKSQVKVTDAKDAIKLITEGGKNHFKLGEHDDITITKSNYDRYGNVFYKMDQTYKGLKVEGKELVIQTDSENNVALLEGEFENSIALDTTPALQGDQAIQMALSSIPEKMVGESTVHYNPELQIYVSQSEPVLVYRTVVEYMSVESGRHLDEVFVDAQKGQIISAVTHIHSALDRKLYNMKGACLKTGKELPGTHLFDNDAPSDGDSHAVAAHKNTGISYWFYKNQLGRDSFDGKGITLKSSVRTTFDSGGGQCSGDNAVFLWAPYNQMAYGEGGDLLVNPANALDITGHELTHGVTSTESNLKYENESGAINEALSDIFGSSAEGWHDSGGTEKGNPSGGIKMTKDNWTLGEDAAQSNDMKRFMFDPQADGRSKDNYEDRGKLSSREEAGQNNDNGYVHTNSGIMNLAFYLLSEGGKHPRDKSSNEVTGIGVEKALEIYYHAATNLFTSTTGFTSARQLLAQSAKTVYGECSTEWAAVNESYDAILVPGDWTKCSTNDDSNTDDQSGNDGGTGNDGNTTPQPEPTPEPVPADVNLALSAKIQASSSYSSSFSPAAAIDGNDDSIWASRTIYNENGQDYLMLDFGEEKRLSEATIDWSGSNYARGIAAMVWSGGQWTRVDQITKSQAGKDKLNLGGISSRYLVVTMTGGFYWKWYIVKELAVR